MFSRKFFLFVVFFLLGLATISVYKQFTSAYNQVFVGGSIPKEPNASPTPTELLPDNGTYNVLLLGYGGGNHDGTYLTDTIMLAHINATQKKVFLISIPRDLWVEISDSNQTTRQSKINAAYDIGLKNGPAGGGTLAKSLVGQVTGLRVDKFVAVSFAGFTNTIDALGGIDVKIDRSFTDSEYPISGRETDLCGKTEADLPALIEIAATSSAAAFPCRYRLLEFTAGTSHMDGETALAFARSRHSETQAEGNDFARSSRQKNVLLAVKNKVLSAGFIPRALPFIASLKDDVVTDFSPQELAYFVGKSDSLKNYSIESISLSDENILKDGWSSDRQYILEPLNGRFDWNSTSTWIATKLSPTPTKSPPL